MESTSPLTLKILLCPVSHGFDPLIAPFQPRAFFMRTNMPFGAWGAPAGSMEHMSSRKKGTWNGNEVEPKDWIGVRMWTTKSCGDTRGADLLLRPLVHDFGQAILWVRQTYDCRRLRFDVSLCDWCLHHCHGICCLAHDVLPLLCQEILRVSENVDRIYLPRFAPLAGVFLLAATIWITASSLQGTTTEDRGIQHLVY